MGGPWCDAQVTALLLLVVACGCAVGQGEGEAKKELPPRSYGLAHQQL